MRKAMKLAGLAAAIAFAIVGFASPAAAIGTPGEHTSEWECDTARGGTGTGTWVSAWCATKSGSGSVKATWYPLSGAVEKMTVYDNYPNGYHTYAFLTVATHQENLPVHTGQSSEDFTFNYKEGLNVNFWVCSSSKDNAACSPRAYTMT